LKNDKWELLEEGPCVPGPFIELDRHVARNAKGSIIFQSRFCCFSLEIPGGRQRDEPWRPANRSEALGDLSETRDLSESKPSTIQFHNI